MAWKVLQIVASIKDIDLLKRYFIAGPTNTTYQTIRKGERIQIRIIILSVLDADKVDEYDGFS